MGQWLENAAKYLETQWGIDSTAARKFALLLAYLQQYGLAPQITSGFRDPSKQAAMRAAWDRGDRAGLRARPADPKASDHCQETWTGSAASKAIDIKCRDEVLAGRIAQALGLTAGIFFSTPDPGHYALR